MSGVSIVIVNWNTRALLAECLDSVSETIGGLDAEVIVVDNDSSDGSPEMIRDRFPSVRLLSNAENVGFARANNQALSASGAPYALLLNSDARLLPGTLEAMLSLVESQPRAGAVGAALRHPDGSFQASHARFPDLWREALILSGLGRLLYGSWYPSYGPDQDGAPRRADWVCGACMLLRREALADAGGLDEGYFMYAEEVDLCYSMQRRGWEVWYHPRAQAIHHGAGSARSLDTRRERYLYHGRVRFFRKHHGEVRAALLRGELYAFTAAKIVVHGLLRALSRGRYGRRVISLGDLRACLRASTAAPLPNPPGSR